MSHTHRHVSVACHPTHRESTDVAVDVPNEVEGAPCGFQLVGRSMRDEELVANSRIVEQVLQA